MSRTHQRHKTNLERATRAIRDWALRHNIVLLDEQAEGFARAAITALRLQEDTE
jgi:hypothetical protein